MRAAVRTPLGIHTHDDGGLGVANALAAVEEGCVHVQGTINGYGERCGNANLASVMANLELKLGHTTVGRDRMTQLSSLCAYIADLANLPLRNDQPFVGRSAFAHKGGIHVAAVLKDEMGTDFMLDGTPPAEREAIYTETALIAKNTMGWSTYLNTLQFDYDKFVSEFDQIAATGEQVTAGLEGMEVPLRVAVMGCVVNGPGEAREADLGVASGNGKGQIFVKGEVIKTVPEAAIVETLIEEAMKIAEGMEPVEGAGAQVRALP